MSMISRKYLHSAFRTISLCLMIASRAGTATPPCTDLLRAKAEQKLAYLRSDRATLDPGCVVYSMQQLGAEHFAAAADVLATYLDFQTPGTEKVDSPGTVYRIPVLGDRYPAATALFEIGMPASPSVVRVIASSASSDLLRKNAMDVLFAVHRENLANGARALNDASRSASDNETAARLLLAAREFAGKCPGERRSACEAALLER